MSDINDKDIVDRAFEEIAEREHEETTNNTIEVLERRIKMLDELYESAKKTSKYPEQWESDTNDLKKAVELMKAFDSVEMPERKVTKETLFSNVFGNCQTILTDKEVGFNQAHDIFKPLIVKRDMEIAELKGKLQTEKRDWELTNELLKDRIDELKHRLADECITARLQEHDITKLKAELTKYDVKNKLKTYYLKELQAMKDKMSEDNIVKIIKEEMKTSHWDIRGLAKAIIGNFNETH